LMNTARSCCTVFQLEHSHLPLILIPRLPGGCSEGILIRVGVQNMGQDEDWQGRML